MLSWSSAISHGGSCALSAAVSVSCVAARSLSDSGRSQPRCVPTSENERTSTRSPSLWLGHRSSDRHTGVGGSTVTKRRWGGGEEPRRGGGCTHGSRCRSPSSVPASFPYEKFRFESSWQSVRSPVWFKAHSCSTRVTPSVRSAASIGTCNAPRRASSAQRRPTPAPQTPAPCSCLPGRFHPQFRDRTRRDIGKSQSIWTDSKMETPGSPPQPSSAPVALHIVRRTITPKVR
jgi:hypothetical protein